MEKNINTLCLGSIRYLRVLHSRCSFYNSFLKRVSLYEKAKVQKEENKSDKKNKSKKVEVQQKDARYQE